MREVVRRSRHGAVVRLSLSGTGQAERARVARWRCDRRTRYFEATTPSGAATRDGDDPDAVVRGPAAADGRPPAQLRPGQAAGVRISDSWRLGGVAATLCARSGAAAPRCTRTRPAGGDPHATLAPAARAAGARDGRAALAVRSAAHAPGGGATACPGPGPRHRRLDDLRPLRDARATISRAAPPSTAIPIRDAASPHPASSTGKHTRSARRAAAGRT